MCFHMYICVRGWVCGFEGLGLSVPSGVRAREELLPDQRQEYHEKTCANVRDLHSSNLLGPGNECKTNFNSLKWKLEGVESDISRGCWCVQRAGDQPPSNKKGATSTI